MPKVWLALWINLVVALSASSAHAARAERRWTDDAALVNAADAVIVAHVIESQTQPGPRDIERHVTLRVLEPIKGSVREGDVVTLVEPGGRLGNLAEIIPGAAHYEPGQTVLVCLSLDRSGHWRTLGMNQGRFLRESAGERAGWVRDGEVQAAGGLPGKWRSESAFKSYARSIARGDFERPEYWEERPALVETASAATSSHPPAAYLSYVAGSIDPVRWNITGTPLRWFSNGTHSGSAGGGMNALTKALAAWTDDPRSNVVLEYGGFTPELRGICAGCEDGVSTIHLGDPNDELPFGTDSMTKIWVDVAAKHTFKGDIFATIRSADIVVANVRYEEKELEELLTREFGVALGFRDANVPGRSPSSDTAIMTRTDGGYGRYGAVLQAWDKEALFAVYPPEGFVVDSLQPAKAEAVVGGDPASFKFTVTGTYGATAPITFRLKDSLPAGVSVSFSPESASSSGTAPVTMSVRAAAGAVAADIPFTIIAEAGAVRREVNGLVTMFDLHVSGTTETLYPNERRSINLVPRWAPRTPAALAVNYEAGKVAVPGVALAVFKSQDGSASVEWKTSAEVKPATVRASIAVAAGGLSLDVPYVLHVTNVTANVDRPLVALAPGATATLSFSLTFANGSGGETIYRLLDPAMDCGFATSVNGSLLTISNTSQRPGVYLTSVTVQIRDAGAKQGVSSQRDISREVSVAVVVPTPAVTPRYKVFRGPDYARDGGFGTIRAPRDVNGERVVLTEAGVWRPLARSSSVYFRGAWLPADKDTFEEVKHWRNSDDAADLHDIDDRGRVAGRHDQDAVVTSYSNAIAGVYEYRPNPLNGVFYRQSAGRAVGAAYSVFTPRPIYAASTVAGAPPPIDITDKEGVATGINKSGHAVGWYKPDGKTKRPFLYRDGKLTTLGSAPGTAVDINDSGSILIVGEDGKSAVLTGTTSKSLPLTSKAVDMNEVGAVIGGAQVFEGGVLRDLNALIDPVRDFDIAEAVSINERGDIAARGARVKYSCRDLESVLLLLVRDDAAAVSPCSYAVARNGDVITVSTGPQCRWEANTRSRWLSLSPSGVGPAMIHIKAEPNPLPFERRAFVSIEGQVLEYIQPAAGAVCTPPAITAQPQPMTLTLGESGELAVSVTSTGSPVFTWSVRPPGAASAEVVSNANAARLIVKPDRVGIWTYSVRVATECGGVDSAQVSVEVREPAAACKAPAAGALQISYSGATSSCSSGNGTPCLPGEVIQFTAAVWGSGIQACDTLAWEFGDGTTATGSTVTRTFTSPGTYDVRLTLANPEGRVTVSRAVTVRQSGAVPTNLAISVEGSLAPNAQLRFSGTASGEVSSWQWNFGDGSTASGQSVTHMFRSAGRYQVQLTAANAAGTAQTTREVVVASLNGCPSMVPGRNVFIWFTAAQSGCTAGVGECLTSEPLAFFVGTFGYNFACGTHTYEWNFGDGTSSSSAAPTHAYSTPGSYPVTVKVTNGSQTVHLSHLVTVKSAADGATNRRRSTRR